MTTNSPTRTNETVETWADGFGIWHARINFLDHGYGPQFLDGQVDRLRAKARRAIRREVIAREGYHPDMRITVKVEELKLDSLNVAHSITYVEHSYR